MTIVNEIYKETLCIENASPIVIHRSDEIYSSHASVSFSIFVYHSDSPKIQHFQPSESVLISNVTKVISVKRTYPFTHIQFNAAFILCVESYPNCNFGSISPMCKYEIEYTADTEAIAASWPFTSWFEDLTHFRWRKWLYLQYLFVR